MAEDGQRVRYPVAVEVDHAPRQSRWKAVLRLPLSLPVLLFSVLLQGGLTFAVWAAIVTGAFSLIVCAALVWNYREARKADPLDSPELAVLAQEIARRPGEIGRAHV